MQNGAEIRFRPLESIRNKIEHLCVAQHYFVDICCGFVRISVT